MSARIILTLLSLSFSVYQLNGQENKDLHDLKVYNVNTLEINEEDMSDLMPLIDLIGDSQVVALGESSHGSGSDFKAKARLIRFLHEYMDFDVILWEAGIYDTHYLNHSLKNCKGSIEAIEDALYAHWGYSAEVKNLFKYISNENNKGHQIDISGFDLQISQPYKTTPKLIKELLNFFKINDKSLLSSTLENKLLSLKEEADNIKLYSKEAINNDSISKRFSYVYKDIAHLSIELLELMKDKMEMLQKIHSPEHISLINQKLISLGGIDKIDEPMPGDPPRSREDYVRRWNQREITNSENIEWFVNNYYRDKRIIIWAHNAHIAEGFLTSDFQKFSTEPMREPLIRPSGSQIRSFLKEKLFSIIFTGYQGKVRKMSDPISLESSFGELNPAPEGSLEDILHKRNFQYAILPLRTKGNFGILSKKLQTARIDTEFIAPQTLNWELVADAFFFIDNIEPFVIEK